MIPASLDDQSCTIPGITSKVLRILLRMFMASVFRKFHVGPEVTSFYEKPLSQIMITSSLIVMVGTYGFLGNFEGDICSISVLALFMIYL